MDINNKNRVLMLIDEIFESMDFDHENYVEIEEDDPFEIRADSDLDPYYDDENPYLEFLYMLDSEEDIEYNQEGLDLLDKGSQNDYRSQEFIEDSSYFFDSKYIDIMAKFSVFEKYSSDIYNAVTSHSNIYDLPEDKRFEYANRLYTYLQYAEMPGAPHNLIEALDYFSDQDYSKSKKSESEFISELYLKNAYNIKKKSSYVKSILSIYLQLIESLNYPDNHIELGVSHVK